MRWLRTAIGVVLVVVFGACAQDESQTVAEPTESPAAAPAASAGAAAAVRTESNAKFGTILVDAQGRTLYTFDRDQGGTVACTGECATRWPPLLSTEPQAGGGVPGLGVVKRPDGNQQVTYKNNPLYRYSGDAKAGDVNGDGVGGVWHVAKVES